MSDWKPGDVAMVTGRYGSPALAMRVTPREGAAADIWCDKFGYLNGNEADWFESARPLVVIDPDNLSEVERLTELLDWALHSEDRPRLADALREFANPTPLKPDEPLGEWAVVLDVEGNVWTRMNDVHWSSEASPRNRQTYAEIDVVRVLSEGVRP